MLQIDFSKEVLVMRRTLLIAVIMVLFVASFAMAADKTLRVLYFQWDPGNAVQALGAQYEKATNGKVAVVTELPAFTDWYTKWLANVQSQDYAWDLVVIDSQWIGMAVAANAVVDITDFVAARPIFKDVPSYYKPYYMGDPTGKGRVWSLPLEADAELLFYRKDLMNDATEKANFKKKFGYELAVPKTWFQLRDIASFFNRPEKNLYGYISKFGKDYDVITWDFNNILWGWGAEFWDRNTKMAKGIPNAINSPAGVEAMNFYKSLTAFAPPGWPTAAFDTTVNSMSQGLVMFAVEWSSFAPSMFDPKNSKVWDKVGVAVPPAGPKAHWVSLGGQPLTVSAFSPNQKEALDYLNWVYSYDNLMKYAQAHGHPSFGKVLSSPDFWKILPQNKLLWEATPFVKDIWNCQGYDELLTATQENLNMAVTGNIAVQKALDNIVERNQKTFDTYYH
jgi:multiple sugar transport system substrate-binding protein